MKILFITSSLSKLWGGTTTSILNLYAGLKYHNHTIHIWSSYTENEKSEIPEYVYGNSDITFFKSSFWRYSSDLKDALKQNIHHYDIVHIHGMWLYPTYIAAKIAREYSIPYVLSPHGMIEPYALHHKALKKQIYWHFIESKNFNHAAAIHAITANEAKNAEKLSNNIKIFTLPNGIKIKPYEEKEFKTPASILYIGRLHPIKGIEPLLDSLAALTTPIHLTIAGTGSPQYEEILKKKTATLKLQQYIHFAGFANDEEKEKLLKKAWFLVVPSYSEVLSMVALEAVASGTPVLITKSANFDDLETNGGGIIIHDNQPDHIADGILRMLQSDLQTMSKNAYTLALKSYAIEEVARQFVLEYNKIIKGCE